MTTCRRCTASHVHLFCIYKGGSICNKNPFITPSTNTLRFNVICQTKDQSVAVIMVHVTLFYFFTTMLSKVFDELKSGI